MKEKYVMHDLLFQPFVSFNIKNSYVWQIRTRDHCNPIFIISLYLCMFSMIRENLHNPAVKSYFIFSYRNSKPQRSDK